jgi:predicted NBD/HSP70 family sugar kinase
VLEGPTGRLPRGRRPTFLRLNDERVIIGVDVRPSQTTVALADANGRFISQEVMGTSADAEAALHELIECIQRIRRSCRGKKIEGVGISLPGRFDHSSDRLVFAPNLKWRDVDIRNPIANATGLEVELENAANACVLAEVWFNRLEECRNLVVITVSEGIGTGLLANGELVRGLNGMAGEFGHVPLDPEGPPCGCGSRGCWEVFGSNRAALRYYFESHAEAAGLTFPDLLSRADQGDTQAAKALERMAHYLGRGMRLIVAGLAPERIVVVGDLTRSWHRFGAIIEAAVQAQVLPGGIAPRIVPAYEDGMARLRGTIALVLQKHFSV